MTWRITSQQLNSSYYGEFECDFQIGAIEYTCKWMISKEPKLSFFYHFNLTNSQLRFERFDVLNEIVFMEMHDKTLTKLSPYWLKWLNKIVCKRNISWIKEETSVSRQLIAL